MNDCEYYQELISRLLDEDLTTEEDAALKSHLESCAQCRLTFEAFSAVSRLVGEAEEPPESLHECIMADIRRTEIKKKNRRLRPVFAAAACLAVVILGTLGIRGTLFSGKSEEIALMTADSAATCEETSQEAAPAEAADTDGMAFAGDVYSARAADIEATEATSGAGDAYTESDGVQGRYVYLDDSEGFEALLGLLAGEPSATPFGEFRAIYTVMCEESGAVVEIYESDSGIFYTDSRDRQWYLCTCDGDELNTFLNIYT